MWRIERDFLYDPGFHGLDIKATEKKYEPFLRGLAHRNDLGYLLEECLGELSLGRLRSNVGGGRGGAFVGASPFGAKATVNPMSLSRITVFRDITFLAAGPASERSRSCRALERRPSVCYSQNTLVHERRESWLWLRQR